MSVPVSIDRLHEEITRFGTTPYLLTVTDDQRAHAVSVHVAWDDAGEALVMETGRSTTANATARPDVTLLWPPYEAGGYSLIVDGTASADGQVAITPRKAVLHRSAAAPEGAPPGSCGNDCVPL